MPQGTKIATCNYCGSRTVLVFDRVRHELTCATCGAPLHEMKAMPVSAARPTKAGKPTAKVATRPLLRRTRKRNWDDDDDDNPRPRHHRRQRFARWLIEEAWDVVEDIFD